MAVATRAEVVRRLVHYVLYLVVFSFSVKLYFLWFENYRALHPEIIEVTAAGYVEEQPLQGVLLWDEQMLLSPVAGQVEYQSEEPLRVAKGDVVAKVGSVLIRSPAAGYFYSALDGVEGEWSYSKLWPDFTPFPFFFPATNIKTGSQMHKGDVIGKLIPQPQELRCLAYLDLSPSLDTSLKRKNAVVKIRTDFEGRDRTVAVITHVTVGQKVKVCLSLPFFPVEFLKSRGFQARVVAGDLQGVMLPDSAVITRDGRNIVRLVQGSQILSRDVEGFPADMNNFFVTKGLVPGNRLVLEADRHVADVIRLW